MDDLKLQELQDLELVLLAPEFIFMIYLESTRWKAFLEAAGQPDEAEVIVNLDVAH